MKFEKQINFLLKLFFRTHLSSFRTVDATSSIEETTPSNIGKIYCTWHENILSVIPNYANRGIYCMVSPSGDGEVLSNILRDQGYNIILGSSGRKGTQALRSAVKLLKSGEDIYITPDGSRGPRRELKNGIAAIAKLSGAKVYVVNYRQASYFRFSSWDRFIMPLAFTKVHRYHKNPIDIKAIDLEGEERAAKFLSLVKEAMDEENPAKDFPIKLWKGLKN